MFKCTCINIEVGSYDNQTFVHSPAHMPKENGYCLDRCIAEEVMILWQLGITTTGCCCGHGKLPAFIGVEFQDINVMKSFGYNVHHNSLRPEDEDSFTPMGKDFAMSVLLNKININKDETI